MQTSPLPNLAAGVNVNSAPQRPASSDAGNDGQFSAALTREIVQRIDAVPRQQQPQPTHARASKSGAHPQPVQAPAQPPAQQAADAAADTEDAAGKLAPATDAAATAQDDAATSDAAASQQAVDPMADMLALVANYNQLLKGGPAAPKTAAPAADGAAAAAQALPGGTLAPAGLPSDQAIATIAGRFASQLHQSGAPAATPTGAPGRPVLKGVGADNGKAAQDPLASLAPSGAPSAAPSAAPGADPSLSPSAAPSLAPSLAPGLGPTIGPTGAPSAAPAEFSAHLAAAIPDAAAAQLLAATAAPTVSPMAAQIVGASDKLSARVGTPGWDEQVGQKIVWMVGGGEQSASLTLNPPDLGPMQVVLSVNGDQASVAFSSAHQEVRHALESALPRLREMMDQSGLSLGSATVSAGNPGQGQAQDQSQGNGNRGARFVGRDTAADAEPAEAPRVRRTTAIGDNGMVDTFA
jgi:flagellar hook-length control protein FliK